MKPLELLRQKTFWMLDALKGSPIRRQLRNVEKLMSHRDSVFVNGVHAPDLPLGGGGKL